MTVTSDIKLYAGHLPIYRQSHYTRTVFTCYGGIAMHPAMPPSLMWIRQVVKTTDFESVMRGFESRIHSHRLLAGSHKTKPYSFWGPLWPHFFFVIFLCYNELDDVDHQYFQGECIYDTITSNQRNM